MLGSAEFWNESLAADHYSRLFTYVAVTVRNGAVTEVGKWPTRAAHCMVACFVKLLAANLSFALIPIGTKLRRSNPILTTHWCGSQTPSQAHSPLLVCECRARRAQGRDERLAGSWPSRATETAGCFGRRCGQQVFQDSISADAEHGA